MPSFHMKVLISRLRIKHFIAIFFTYTTIICPACNRFLLGYPSAQTKKGTTHQHQSLSVALPKLNSLVVLERRGGDDVLGGVARGAQHSVRVS